MKIKINLNFLLKTTNKGRQRIGCSSTLEIQPRRSNLKSSAKSNSLLSSILL